MAGLEEAGKASRAHPSWGHNSLIIPIRHSPTGPLPPGGPHAVDSELETGGSWVAHLLSSSP